ncbi:DUF4372 domain-containing protein [uncultured Parabacteroides sp.]|uniref:DUF4372 domain-containing protein n=1 Tax=uncultured Parabacteroides sp. TaxID=512312 RepID=UPI0035A6F215
MNKEKYVFSQLVSFLDRNPFNYLVRKYNGDRYVKHLTCWNQFLAMMFGQDKLRVQEQTPVYTIIEPATVPLKTSSPKKLLILVTFIFLAFIGGCGYLLIKKYAVALSPRPET